jgi:DnaJ family protein A protein 2
MGCDGNGMKVNIMRMGNMIQQSVVECGACRGKGKIIEESNKCDGCNGKCYVVKEKTIQIPLKSGLSHGNKINLSGKGNQFKNVKTDLILVINEQTHSVFKRLDNNLFIDIELKLYQALFGFDKIINHLDGRQLHISSSGKTDFNAIRKISGEGIRSLQTGNKGDLFIRFTVDLPNFVNLPGETKTQLKSIIQNFNKIEVESEAKIGQTQNLIKTILIDCKQDQKEAILEAFNHIKAMNNKKSNDSRKPNRFGGDSDEDYDTGDSGSGGQPGCAQQ